MRTARLFLGCFLVLVAASGARGQSTDLRDRLGTRSLEAARHMDRALTLMREKKNKEALAAIEAALKADPKFQMAYYQKGHLLSERGDISESIEAYKTSLSKPIARSRRLRAAAASDLAILHAKLGEHGEAGLWFTRTVLEDSDNANGQRGRAYRNLAISLRLQGRHLAAAIALALAFQDKAPNVSERMLDAFIDKVPDDQEAASILTFAGKPVKVEKRTQPTRLTSVTLDGNPTEPIADILADVRGRYVVAVPANADHYFYLALGGKPALKRQGAPVKIASACLAGDHLYLLSNGPARIDKLEPATGKVVKTYRLPVSTAPATSLVVLPEQELAFFCIANRVHGSSLRSSNVFKTDVPGQAVVAHPNQQVLYSSLRPERFMGGGYVIINGRPHRFTRRGGDWRQTTIFQAVVTRTGVLISGVRRNAASNGQRLAISADGRWVAVAGGGGYRPSKPGAAGGGYGVAVFSADNLEKIQGFFKTDAYPLGVCFNPVTGQVAALRSKDGKVYDLADPNAGTDIQGPFSGAAAWSGDGRYLVLAGTSGLRLYENAIDAAERARAGSWWKDIKVTSIREKAAPAGGAAFQAVPALAKFAVKKPSPVELTALFTQAAEKGRTERLAPWADYSVYSQDIAHRQAAEEAARDVTAKTDLGIAIFKIKKALRTHKDSVPLQLYLAEALRQNERADDAEKLYETVIHADAGRTELTLLALQGLAQILSARGEGLSALHCLGAALSLDRGNAKTVSLAGPLLRKHKLTALANRVAQLGTSLAGGGGDSELPKLEKPKGEGKKYSAAELYRKAVWSVVLIQTGRGSGSGVCVGRSDIIVTNHHVIADTDGDIFVTPFVYRDRELVKLPKVRATVLLRFEKEDVAVLKLEKEVPTLKPLPVAATDAGAGEKVYALGSPGLGREVLTQSISEGLVSAPKRVVDGNAYVQHSAAVNPGNSGGPLLDETCQVVGLVTLKARLENVSFAVRVETLRKIFKSP